MADEGFYWGLSTRVFVHVLVWFLEHLDDMLCLVTKLIVERIDYRRLVGCMCGLFILIYSSVDGALPCYGFWHIYWDTTSFLHTCLERECSIAHVLVWVHMMVCGLRALHACIGGCSTSHAHSPRAHHLWHYLEEFCVVVHMDLTTLHALLGHSTFVSMVLEISWWFWHMISHYDTCI